MTADLLIRNFEALAAAPGGVPKLRNLILRLAVRGQLVPHDPPGRTHSNTAIHSRRQPIPQSWRWVRLADIAAIFGGGTPSKDRPEYWDGNIPWVSPKDMGTDAVCGSEDSVATCALEEGRLKPIPSGSVLIVGRSGILRRKLPVAITRVACTINQDLKALVLRGNDTSAEYLRTLLKGHEAFILKRFVKGGVTVESLKYDELFAHLFALPPLPEQHRIVAKVDELMALCDELESRQEAARTTQAALTRSALHHVTTAADPADFATRWGFIRDHFQHLEARPENVAELRRAILQLAVMGRLTPGLGWKTTTLGELGTFVGGGTPSKAVAAYWSGRIPWVSPKDMKVTHLADSVDHISTEAVETSSVKLLCPGAVLMVVRGMILSHSFPVAITRASVTLNQDMKALVLHDPRQAEYVLLALRGLRDSVLAIVERSSHGTCRIDTDKLRHLPVPVPPLAEQHRIVAKVDELTKLCDELEAGLKRERADADGLFDAVVARIVGEAA